MDFFRYGFPTLKTTHNKEKSLIALLPFRAVEAEISHFVFVAAELGINMPARTRASLKRGTAVTTYLDIGFSRKLLRELPPQTANEGIGCDSQLDTPSRISNNVCNPN
jgi:hypothetical protein